MTWPPPHMHTRALVPDCLTVLSINARGLNKPERRSGALRDFHAKRASIVLIQETHFKEGSRAKMTNHHYPTGYYSDYHAGRSRGTAILVNKKIPFVETGQMTDKEGRFLFFKGTIAGQVYTFANIYAPYNRQYRFLAHTLKKLQPFTEGIPIVGGDLNVALNLRWDTSSGHSWVSTQNLNSIQTLLTCYKLIDCWRAYHPDEKDYTFFSHNTYTRLDYLFTSHYHLTITHDAH
ncbi:Hypothetical predicted protein [Pelobates cultripes]|uniref:exodeoxyribonuclease III n=1 Tax=Pelobates cultripes TaxID=61616 RepID=A0AAD1SVX7_PELCU|nr:Hypothetical predicted protein [Pelobates cultripes]